MKPAVLVILGALGLSFGLSQVLPPPKAPASATVDVGGTFDAAVAWYGGVSQKIASLVGDASAQLAAGRAAATPYRDALISRIAVVWSDVALPSAPVPPQVQAPKAPDRAAAVPIRTAEPAASDGAQGWGWLGTAAGVVADAVHSMTAGVAAMAMAVVDGVSGGSGVAGLDQGRGWLDRLAGAAEDVRETANGLGCTLVTAVTRTVLTLESLSGKAFDDIADLGRAVVREVVAVAEEAGAGVQGAYAQIRVAATGLVDRVAGAYARPALLDGRNAAHSFLAPGMPGVAILTMPS